MPTTNQLIRYGREEKRRTDRTRALVFGLLVTRAQNFVHSVLFPIPVFCSVETFFNLFCAFPIIRKLSMQWQFLWFYVSKCVLSIIIMHCLFSVGYLFMDDLSRAISQFFPGISGGLGGGGGGNTPMPPTNSSEFFLGGYSEAESDNSQRLFLNLEVEDQNKDPIEEQVEAESFRCDRIKQKIVNKTHAILLSKGYIVTDTDITTIIDVAMFDEEAIDIDRRKKRFYYLYSCLGKEETPFWREILKLLDDYNIKLSNTDTYCDD